MDKILDNKEYLKKYLGGSDKKKRKIKKKSVTVKSKIIDDDLDIRNMKPIDENELDIYDLAEDAPQIAGIIDDRPEEIRVLSEYRETKKWKVVTREYEDVQVSAVDGGDSDVSIPREISKNNSKEHINSDSEVSVKRRQKPDSDADASPPRKSTSLHRSRGEDSDNSPPRRSPKSSLHRSRGDDSDNSPPRRSNPKSSSHRSRGDDSDNSPPRRNKPRESLHRSKGDVDFDHSPPRRSNALSKWPRKNYPNSRDHRNDTEADFSPERLKRNDVGKEKRNSARDDLHKHREYRRTGEHRKPDRSEKMTETLDGKKAGLQNAADMKKEALELRRKQEESLSKLGDDVSGRGAATIMRDRKTGKRRDMKEEARQKREKDAKNAEIIEKYAVWGKGMKQIDDRAVKMKEDLHEMTKPVARYADDEDLENMRRNEEKEGDPMLEYMRNKRKKEGGVSAKPRYQGSYLPNRHNIKPGHRWDGVDRSNGYEKKWFEAQNARKAREEEAFKWSTEDM